MKINFFKLLMFLIIVAITIGIVLLITSKREYCIQFKANDVIVEEIYTSGKEILELPTAPVKQGYTFKGWYFDNETWTQKLEENTYENVELTTNVTVYAYYEQDQIVVEKYDITFMADGQVVDTIKTAGNELISLPTAPVKQGYTFKGWYFDNETWTQKLEENTYENVELTTNVTVYAYYEQDAILSVEYILDGNGEIIQVNNIEEVTTLIIPNKINGETVKSLKNNLFKDNTTLEHVELPDTITDLGQTTFKNCTNLSYVKLPSNIKVLYEYTFENCTALKSITLPNTLVEIRSDCFRNSGLESINFPDSLTDIWQYTFAYCENLSQVNLNKIEYIGDMSFQHCTNLMSIEIPATLKDFGQNVFSDCSSLENIVLPDVKLDLYYSSFYNTKYFNTESNWENEVLYIGKHLITVSRDFNATSYTVKDGTIDIAECAFYIATTKTLKSINIPDSVVYIGSKAFEYMSTLNTANLSQNLIGIGKKAFFGTAILDSSSSYWEGNYLYLDNYLITMKATNINAITIKEGTIGIADGELLSSTYASAVTSISLPNSLKFIGLQNFQYMTLESIILPKNLQIIGEKAFYYCRSLTNVDTFNCTNLTKICYSAFAGCNITEFTIPQTVIFVEGYIFNFNKNIIVNCQISEKPATWDDLWCKVNGGGTIQINWGIN